MAPHIYIDELLYHLFGRKLGVDELVAIFSTRLDESGTDGRSLYTVVAGVVASIGQWETLEGAWRNMLERSNISLFHTQEFQARSGKFDSWSDLKCQRFSAAQAKIIKKHTLFRIAVGVENVTHAEIKNKMKGIKGFRPDSNYGLCLRCLMHLACENIASFAPAAKVTFMLEDGPWAAGAVDVYSRIRRMTSKWNPSKHAHMLGNIAVVGKGESLSLEAADYLAGRAHRQMCKGRFRKRDRPQVSFLFTHPLLEQWYQRMLVEKERRRAYRDKKFKKPDS